MNIDDYMSFLQKVKKRAQRDLRVVERLKRKGTLNAKVRYLFGASPTLKSQRHIHLLIMAYWTIFDSVDDYSRILNATPAESITRTRRSILENEIAV